MGKVHHLSHVPLLSNPNYARLRCSAEAFYNVAICLSWLKVEGADCCEKERCHSLHRMTLM